MKIDNSNNPFVIQEGRLKNSHLDNVYKNSWVEDGLISGNRGEVIGRSFDFVSLNSVAWVFAILFILLLSRLMWLQIITGDYYFKIAEGNRIRQERLESRRGIIYDRNMKPLVHNTANFLLYVMPADLPKEPAAREVVLRNVSRVIAPLSPRQGLLDLQNGQSSLNESQIYEQIQKAVNKINPKTLEGYQPLFITDNIDYDKAMLLELETDYWKGVKLSTKIRRDYQLSSQSLSHLLGYTGKISRTELDNSTDEYLPIDYIGKNGLEFFYESELRGTAGKKQIEVDAMGKIKKVLNSTDAIDGHNLVLTIDSEVQKKLEEIMRSQLAVLKLKRASAVVTNPQNGEILALVSLPAYDDNLFSRGITKDEYQGLLKDPDRPLFNRAIAGEFPCGSTIKPVMAAAALNEGIITENTHFLSTGGVRIGTYFYPDWKAGGHGQTNVKKALAESVNTFFYIIGGGYEDFTGLGLDRIVRYDKLFGLGEQAGIDLPGEANGFVPTRDWKENVKKEHWYTGDTYHLAIGQGDLTTTPLQVAQFTQFFANGGKIYRPHLVRNIIEPDGAKYLDTEIAVVKQNFIKPDAVEIVRQGMRQTVTSGSARSIEAVVPVEVAGKTGSAQWSSKKAPQAWFTGFAPFDKPQVVITVLIEEGKEGSSAATPVAREFLKWYFSGKTATTTPKQ